MLFAFSLQQNKELLSNGMSIRAQNVSLPKIRLSEGHDVWLHEISTCHFCDLLTLQGSVEKAILNDNVAKKLYRPPEEETLFGGQL